MHPSHHASKRPRKPAYVMAYSGESVTYGELEDRSNQGAHRFRKLGLGPGDAIAFLLENHPRYYELLWAAQRSGLRYTCISSKLTADEAAYIVRDSDARLLVSSPALADVARELAAGMPNLAIYMVGSAVAPFPSFEAARETLPTTPIPDPSRGYAMLYSSGTTGRPKGVKRAPPAGLAVDAPQPNAVLGEPLFGWSSDTVYLSPAPLYHAAPLGWSMGVLALGGTVITMEHFDAEDSLRFIEAYRVTSAQWVPTHFIRMLKLGPEWRSKYDLSSLQAVFHAAAPCPVEVKEQMLDWWGPIIHEYHAGTEGNGICVIGPREWLSRKGSVGRAVNAEVVICSDEGDPLPPRTEGLVFFRGGPAFEYHGDAEKTAASQNKHGGTTLGDVGWVDDEGYLYLTDRKNFMIISGGVNIYPQEIENLLVTHPHVADVAVVGAPHPEMGEEVVAVIQPANWCDAGPELAAELLAWTRHRLSHIKAPRRIEFMRELPRAATGKLFKRPIREAYWSKAQPAVESRD